MKVIAPNEIRRKGDLDKKTPKGFQPFESLLFRRSLLVAQRAVEELALRRARPHAKR